MQVVTYKGFAVIVEKNFMTDDTIYLQGKARVTCKNGFMECLKSVESENKSCEVKQNTDAGMYRQTISEKIQNMPYHPSNDLDTTMISISDAGIERMMKDAFEEIYNQ